MLDGMLITSPAFQTTNFGREYGLNQVQLRALNGL